MDEEEEVLGLVQMINVQNICFVWKICPSLRTESPERTYMTLSTYSLDESRPQTAS